MSLIKQHRNMGRLINSSKKENTSPNRLHINQSPLIRINNQNLIFSCRSNNSLNNSFLKSNLIYSNRQTDPLDFSFERRRPTSLNAQNDLFKKLAHKLQKSRESRIDHKKEILNEYYEEGNQKQNVNRNMPGMMKKNENLMSLTKSKKSVTNTRYDQPSKIQKIEKQVQKLKFNKIKISKKKSQQDYDFVRTSQAQMKSKMNKYHQQGLDMNHLF